MQLSKHALHQQGNFSRFFKESWVCMQRAIHATLMDIAGGLAYLHSVGVLHGDLKVFPTPFY